MMSNQQIAGSKTLTPFEKCLMVSQNRVNRFLKAKSYKEYYNSFEALKKGSATNSIFSLWERQQLKK